MMSKSRFIIDLANTPANSRSPSTRRSRGDKPLEDDNSNMASNTTKSIRRTRSSAASAMASVNGDEEMTDEFPPPSEIRSPLNKDTGKAAFSRASMSSVSTANDYATSSGYSTPATSAVNTPAVLPKKEIGRSGVRPWGRPASSLANSLPPAALNAFQRARNLRNSEFSLNPVGNKRKRPNSDDEDDEDSDNSPDAQIAKALQDEENAKVNTFLNDNVDEPTPRRARRALRTIRPKADYMSDFSDDEPEAKARSIKHNTTLSDDPSTKATSTSKAKRPRVISVADDSAESDRVTVDNSEESEFIFSDSDDSSLAVVSRSSSEVPLASLSATRKAATRGSVIKQESTSFKGRGTSSRGRGRSRGGAAVPIRSAGLSAASRLEAKDTKQSNSISTPPYSDDESNEADEVVNATNQPLGSEPSELSDVDSDDLVEAAGTDLHRPIRRGTYTAQRWADHKAERRAKADRARLEAHHSEILTMWKDLENLPAIKTTRAPQPANISRELKPFQLEGLNWMQAMEKTKWGGGLLGDEMGMGKTIQAVSLIMSDYPAKNPSLVLIPPVALMQWQQEIGDYTDGTLKTFVFHGTNKNTKGMSVKELKKFDVILMSYNSLESMFRHQEKGFKRKDAVHFQKSVIHQINFHRVILDEAHSIKTRTTGVAKACFALKAAHKWCLSGTPLQNRIGELFSLVRFLDIRPFACYFCKQCSCSTLEWTMNADNRCTGCNHSGMQHVSVFNQELLNPIQKHGNRGPGKLAFGKLRLLTDRFMLRRVKRDHSSAMELPAKEIYVNRQFFGEEENDFAGSIMNNGTRKFETYVAQGVLLNNYANIFGLIMQMRQVADHPDLILKKNAEGGQNIIVCCICDETAEEAIRSTCRHDFCRSCARNYLKSSDETNTKPDCPQCHIPLSIDLEQPEIEQDQQMVKKSSIINRIKMENWTSSSKIELLVYELHALRSHNSSSKSIIFSQFTTMLQLVEWRLRRAGITTVMLDGSMTPAQRQASINHFMSDVNVECFLVSLKAGGVALNLTEASKVFIVDPWWNPAAEWQSADRCHRIGQCRPCSITRLCIEDSVESRMVLLQEKKANMINSTINADDSAMESLTPEDMQFLFRGN